MNNKLKKQAKQFVQEVCIDAWQMNEKEIKQYCLMIVKQNVVMAKINKDYLETAVAYMPFIGLTAEEIKKILKEAYPAEAALEQILAAKEDE